MYWMVARNEDERPALEAADVNATCTCCTYTLNGVPVTKQEGDLL